MTEHEQKVLKLVSEAAIYVPFDCEGIRIQYWDTEAELDDNDEPVKVFYFYGEGEESGDSYQVDFKEVNLETDMFYKLVLMEAQ